jgi:hypothetical protein
LKRLVPKRSEQLRWSVQNTCHAPGHGRAGGCADQDSLESLALKLGMLVASSLLEDEVTRLCGPRHERQPHRTHTRYGHQRGAATLAGQKIPKRGAWTRDPIESALSVTRRVTARVTRWRDGDMRRRWCVAGLLRAESQFRRVKGHRALTTLIKALEESTRARRSGIERGGA